MVAAPQALEPLTLEVLSGRQAGLQIPLSAGEYTVGRSVAATLTFSEPGVSRMHARLRINPRGQCFIRDLRSTNGVQLNGERVGPAERRLRRGDQLRLGRGLSLRLDSCTPTVDTDSFDPISGAFDRKHLAARVDRLIRRARGAGQSLMMAVVDVDQLSLINDRHGMGCGDDALRVLAERLQAAAGPAGLVARHDEDTFILLLTGAAHATAHVLEEELQRLQVQRRGESVCFRASVGVSFCGGGTRGDAADLFVQALRELQKKKAAQVRG